MIHELGRLQIRVSWTEFSLLSVQMRHFTVKKKVYLYELI